MVRAAGWRCGPTRPSPRACRPAARSAPPTASPAAICSSCAASASATRSTGAPGRKPTAPTGVVDPAPEVEHLVRAVASSSASTRSSCGRLRTPSTAARRERRRPAPACRTCAPDRRPARCAPRPRCAPSPGPARRDRGATRWPSRRLPGRLAGQPAPLRLGDEPVVEVEVAVAALHAHPAQRHTESRSPRPPSSRSRASPSGRGSRAERRRCISGRCRARAARGCRGAGRCGPRCGRPGPARSGRRQREAGGARLEEHAGEPSRGHGPTDRDGCEDGRR